MPGETFLRIFAFTLGLCCVLVFHRLSIGTILFLGVTASVTNEIMVKRGASEQQRRRMKIGLTMVFLLLAVAFFWWENGLPTGKS